MPPLKQQLLTKHTNTYCNDFRVGEHDTGAVPLGFVQVEAEGLTLFQHLAVRVGEFADLQIFIYDVRKNM